MGRRGTPMTNDHAERSGGIEPERMGAFGTALVLVAGSLGIVDLLTPVGIGSLALYFLTPVGLALAYLGHLRSAGATDRGASPDRLETDVWAYLESFPIALMKTEPSGRIIRANLEAHTVLGRAPGTLLDLPVVDLAWSDSWPTEEADPTGLPLSTHTSLYAHPDGIQREIEVLRRSIGHGPEPATWLMSFHDVSERNEKDREREALRARVEQSQRLQTMDTLAGGIAHDFNNLLAPILGYSEMAQMVVSEDSELHGDLGQIRTAAQRAKELVAQMMEFSRPEAHALGPVHLQGVVREVTALLRASVPSTIRIVGHADHDTNPVLGSATQLHQVLFNLCTNASHAMPDGGTIEVAVDSMQPLATMDQSKLPPGPGPFVRLRVSDDGEGTSPDTVSKIFEPFFTTKDAGNGTGLGLSTVRGIVASLGGTITVDSEVAVGTTLTLCFPPLRADQEEDADSEARLTAVPGDGQILLVDDEVGVLNVTERGLSRLGYDVRAYDSSAEALAAFGGAPAAYDLVLTDQTMPEMTGLQLAREIRNVRPDVPIVVTSGYPEAVSEGEMQDMGRCEFLPKPASPNQIGLTVARNLGRSAQ